MRLTKEQIIEETVAFYSKDTTRRAVTNSGCSYNTEDDRHCAVGRCMMGKYHKQGTGLKNNGHAVCDVFEGNDCDSLDGMLQVKYRGHGLDFWGELQTIHDVNKNWHEDSGLSELGGDRVKNLKMKFSK